MGSFFQGVQLGGVCVTTALLEMKNVG